MRSPLVCSVCGSPDFQPAAEIPPEVVRIVNLALVEEVDRLRRSLREIMDELTDPIGWEPSAAYERAKVILDPLECKA